jgi:hypothetical protein
MKSLRRFAQKKVLYDWPQLTTMTCKFEPKNFIGLCSGVNLMKPFMGLIYLCFPEKAFYL